MISESGPLPDGGKFFLFELRRDELRQLEEGFVILQGPPIGLRAKVALALGIEGRLRAREALGLDA